MLDHHTNIRYKISPRTNRLNLLLSDRETHEEIVFDHYKGIVYFVDILEPRTELGLMKMRIYFPDGKVITGEQCSWNVELHFVGDNHFDGRFNLIPL